MNTALTPEYTTASSPSPSLSFPADRYSWRDSDDDSDDDNNNNDHTSANIAAKYCLDISIDMTEQQYLAQQQAHASGPIQVDTNLSPSGLPYTTGSAAAVAYPSQELAPSSAVSSFNFPAATDSTLLTPVSSASSPPMSQRGGPTKGMRSYNGSTAAASGAPSPSAPVVSHPPQQPTPPTTSRMFFNAYGDVSVSVSSQSSSPMTTHLPAVTEGPGGPFEYGNYISHSPSMQQQSPREEIPPPIDTYLGNYSVSGSNEPVPEVSSHYADYHSSVHGQPPVDFNAGMVARRQSHPQLPMLQSPGPLHPTPHLLPLLNGHTTPQPFRGARHPNIEDLRDPRILAVGQPGAVGFQAHHMGSGSSNSRSTSAGKRQTKRKPSARRTGRNTSLTGSHPPSAFIKQELPSARLTEPLAEDEKLQLQPEADEEAKFLWGLRDKYMHEKGRGMWDVIGDEYENKYKRLVGKAALQMKVSRAVTNFGIWPEREVELLKEAYVYDETHRYSRIIAFMKTHSGNRLCYDWKPQHIEAKLVKMGWEEARVDDLTQSRNRRRMQKQRRQQMQRETAAAGEFAQNYPPPNMPVHVGDAGWANNSLGLQQHYPSYSGLSTMGGHKVPYEEMLSGSVGQPMSREEAEGLWDQILERRGTEALLRDDFSSEDEKDDSILRDDVSAMRGDPDAMDTSGAGNDSAEARAEAEAAERERKRRQSKAQSEKVARQACEQLLMSQATIPDASPRFGGGRA